MDILERFLKYVKIETTSSSSSDLIPSTKSQYNLARVLIQELKDIGLEVYFDEEHCYVYGILKGNIEAPSIGFINHLDTSESAKGADIKPTITNNYNGEEIKLKNGVTLNSNIYPNLKEIKNKTLITSDGTTLLGADDKAGIAEVMTMLDYFTSTNESHGDICVCFTPDEEIGKDTDFFDFKKFPAKYAYTVDGTELGEIAYENFNAASINITIKGTISHLGYAKGILVNSLAIAHELYGMLPNETPSNTENYEGYYHLSNLQGDEETTVMRFIIRDFYRANFEERKNTIKRIINELNKKYGNRIEIEIKDSYYNMKDIIEENRHLIEYVKEVMIDLGVTPVIKPIRGGTSGARLSFMGLPCPNLGTGGHNFHSYEEYITLEDMISTSEILIGIVKKYAKAKDTLERKRK